MEHILLITLPTQLNIGALVDKTDLVKSDLINWNNAEKLIRIVITADKCTLFPVLEKDKISLILGDISISFLPEETIIIKKPDEHFQCAPSWFQKIKIEITEKN